jgi:ATP-dependent RNA helicase RhlE
METFKDLNLSKQLLNVLEDLGFAQPTPIQSAAYPVILSGQNVVGIAQTGTGKTLAYLLPILQELKFSAQLEPRVLILVPTRELVTQVVTQIESLTKYMSVRVIGVFGGSNIRVQKQVFGESGANVVVATPGRLYDLVIAKSIKLNAVKKLVIDEVDVMLDLGFRHQLTNLFELLPERRQNIMFSATMTDEIDALIADFFVTPVRIDIAVSGTPLENITQRCYPVRNYHTKVNLLTHLLWDRTKFAKALIFVSSKRIADRLHATLMDAFGTEIGLIHANKSQNYRTQAIVDFERGMTRALVTTDVMARGLDLDKITHVINFDTPIFPENYMHRIGRTGRATELGNSILFFTEKEAPYKEAIETLMNVGIPMEDFPEEVEISYTLAPEETPKDPNAIIPPSLSPEKGAAFHEKSAKNSKTNTTRGERKKRRESKHKKPISRGDKFANRKK